MTWAIVTGMAIGAVVGGGSAALQKKDILQGALMGGVTGAVSGGIGSLAAAPVEAGVASGVGDAGFGALTNTGSVASGVNAFESALPGTAGSIGGVGGYGSNGGCFNSSYGFSFCVRYGINWCWIKCRSSDAHSTFYAKFKPVVCKPNEIFERQ